MAAVLFSWDLGAKSLWIDEAVSWDMAVSSIPQLFARIPNDVHPPVYYLLLRGWIAIFGDSFIGLRSLSVVASLVSVCLLLRLARGVLSPALSALAALWLTVSPHTVYFAQEARMYALATACVLGCCVAYRQWVDSTFRQASALVFYAIAAAMAVYVHYFTALALVAVALHFLILYTRPAAGAPQPPARPFLIANGAIVLALLPWMAVAVSQLTRGQVWRTSLMFHDVASELWIAVARLWLGVFKIPATDSRDVLVVMGVTIAGIVALALNCFRRPRDERDLFLLLVAVLPLAVGAALMPITGFLNLPRYLAYSHPLLVLACVRGFAAAKRPAVLVLVGISAAVSLPYLGRYYATPDRDYDARPFAEALRATGGQDRILVVPDYFTIALRYFWRDARLEPIATPAALSARLDNASSAGERPWVLVDYRWWAMNGPITDHRLEEIAVPSGNPRGAKLYRQKEVP